MAVVTRVHNGRKVYWVAFRTNERLPNGKRKQEWERVGTDKRVAEALNRKRLKEVADGTYSKGPRPTMPFGEWLRHWMDRRTNRNAADDRKLIERFLLSRGWLCAVPCEELRPRHAQQLVRELKVTKLEDGSGVISEKYVSNIYGLFATACTRARSDELMLVDPCELGDVKLRRKPKHGVRVNYETDDVLEMAACPDDEAMVFAMLALLTGMREGEVCGRRWRDWDEHSMPLGCLQVTTQYDDRPLKTEGDEGGEHPRNVPVHPALDRLLRWWWESGFEFTYCRKPTRDDFIVPRTFDREGRSLNHTRSSGYKLWRKGADLAGIKNRSLHSTRHTFLTLCRRGGARRDIIERVTHNAVGDMVDHYTHIDWVPLCEAVLCLKLPIDSLVDQASEVASFPGNEGGGAGNRSVRLAQRRPALTGRSAVPGGPEDPPKRRAIPSDAARCCASQPERTPADTTLPPGLVAVRVEVDGAVARTEVLPGDTVRSLSDRAHAAYLAMAEVPS